MIPPAIGMPMYSWGGLRAAGSHRGDKNSEILGFPTSRARREGMGTGVYKCMRPYPSEEVRQATAHFTLKTVKKLTWNIKEINKRKGFGMVVN